MSQFIDQTIPAWTENRNKLPRDLPRGLISPPAWACDTVAEMKAKFAPAIVSNDEVVRTICNNTLYYYFGGLGFDVLYRPSPDGPEVLAIGVEEIVALTKSMCLEERSKLRTWLS